MIGKSRIPRGNVRLSGAQLRAGIDGVLHSGGPAKVSIFEEALAGRLEVMSTVALGSGKAALAGLLLAYGARPGDGVILSAFNVPEVPAVIKALGLRPLMADIDLRTFNIDPNSAERLAENGARFLLATHLYGNPAPLDALTEVANRHELILIEDCAQALGATWDGRPVGGLGHPALFSFGPMKNLNTLKGGAATAPDPAVIHDIRGRIAGNRPSGTIEVAKTLAVCSGLAVATHREFFSNVTYHGIKLAERVSKGLSERVVKMRPDEWEQGRIDVDTLMIPMASAQAGVGLAALGTFDVETRRRVDNAVHLQNHLSKIRKISIQQEVRHAKSVWTQVVVRVADRNQMKAGLFARGIDATSGYLMDCSRLFADARLSACPNARALEESNLYLPVGPDLDANDMDFIASTVEDLL